ncbi:MAG: metalloregulator ArsR/SmtB family transcription factor [Allobranchiibius sp.]
MAADSDERFGAKAARSSAAVRGATTRSSDQSRTRDRVLEEISENGPLSAADLGVSLGLTPAAVRRHLDGLAEHGLVEEAAVAVQGSRGRGRPARAYVLSSEGHTHLQGSYDDLAVSAMDFLTRTAGSGAVRAFAAERAGRLALAARPAVEAAGPDPEARVEALAGALTEQGYAASTRPLGDGTSRAGMQLCQGHCPVQHVATRYPEFCETEAQAFSDLLGVHVQRLASLAHGEHVCTTFVPTSTSLPATGSATSTTTCSTSERN